MLAALIPLLAAVAEEVAVASVVGGVSGAIVGVVAASDDD